jgi:ankyrin repeat protein
VWKIGAVPENALHIACEEGYDALVLKLLHEDPGLQTLEGLEKCLIAAISYRQQSVVQVLLKLLPTEPYALFSLPRLRRILYKTKTDVVETVLEYAAGNNCLWVIPSLLKHGARPSSPRGISALHKAAWGGHEEVVTMLSKRILWRRGRKLSGILLCAIKRGHEGTVRILVDRGAGMPHDPSSPGAKHLAAKEGHERIFRLLLSKDSEDYYADPRISLDTHRSPARTDLRWCCLHFAIYGRHYNIAKFLLETDTMPRYHIQHRATALPLAAKRGCSDIVKLLLETGFDVSAPLLGKSALELAATSGYTRVMTLLLDAGATVGLNDLPNAVSSGSVSAVSLLLDSGANIQTEDSLGYTPLHLAVLDHHPKVVHLLLQSGAKKEAINCYATTPLLLAIQEKQVECVSLLLEYGADTESQPRPWTRNQMCGTHSTRTQSALSCAITSNWPRLIPRLLQYGANIEAEGYMGQRPLHKAAGEGNVAALETLLASGARKHARDEWQRTALHYAAEKGACDAISTLLRWGFDIHAKDKNGQTPLHVAPYSKAYGLLVSHGAHTGDKDHSGMSAADSQANRRYEHYASPLR